MQTIAVKVGKGRKQHVILFESTGRGTVPRNAARRALQEAGIELNKHMDAVVTLTNSIRSKLSEINNPGKIGIEFGVELGGEIGIPLVTAGSAKANFTITLEWENR